MNARQLIQEDKNSQTRGLYADLSNWPHSVDYYVKCSVCGQTHGSYKTMKEAHRNRACDQCDLKSIQKIKDEIRQVTAEPEKKVKPLSAIVHEAEDLPVPEPLEDDDDPLLGMNVKKEANRLLFSIWTLVAIRRFAAEFGVDPADIEIKNYEGDYDEDDPNATTYFTIDIPGEQWTIFKDDSVAREIALASIKSDLENEPGIFSQEWLTSYIDNERLADAIGDPYEDYGDEERNLNYKDKLNKMVEEDRIESDDPLFFKSNGDPRVANKAREKQLEQILDTWIEETKPTVDPWEYLRDIYGDEAGAEALKLAGIDEDKAAQDAVDADGWQHFLARYDGNSTELQDGFVAVRIN